MKRSYFVPIVIPACLFLLLGVGCIAVPILMGPCVDEVQEYAGAGEYRSFLRSLNSYDTVVQHACEHYQHYIDSLKRERIQMLTEGSMLLWMSVFLFAWTFDRRRLLKKFTALEKEIKALNSPA